MQLTIHSGFTILAIVLFLVGLFMVLIPGAPQQFVQALLFGGLASFAVGHLP